MRALGGKGILHQQQFCRRFQIKQRRVVRQRSKAFPRPADANQGKGARRKADVNMMISSVQLLLSLCVVRCYYLHPHWCLYGTPTITLSSRDDRRPLCLSVLLKLSSRISLT